MPDVHATTMSITLYPEELAAIEQWAEQEGRSKSNMIRRLIQQERDRRSERTPKAA